MFRPRTLTSGAGRPCGPGLNEAGPDRRVKSVPESKLKGRRRSPGPPFPMTTVISATEFPSGPMTPIQFPSLQRVRFSQSSLNVRTCVSGPGSFSTGRGSVFPEAFLGFETGSSFPYGFPHSLQLPFSPITPMQLSSTHSTRFSHSSSLIGSKESSSSGISEGSMLNRISLNRIYQDHAMFDDKSYKIRFVTFCSTNDAGSQRTRCASDHSVLCFVIGLTFL